MRARVRMCACACVRVRVCACARACACACVCVRACTVRLHASACVLLCMVALTIPTSLHLLSLPRPSEDERRMGRGPLWQGKSGQERRVR